MSEMARFVGGPLDGLDLSVSDAVTRVLMPDLGCVGCEGKHPYLRQEDGSFLYEETQRGRE